MPPRCGSSTCCGPDDLVIANDAATLPASLHGRAHGEWRRRSRCGLAGRPRWTDASERRTDFVALVVVRRRRLPDAHRGPSARRRHFGRAGIVSRSDAAPGDRLALLGDGRGAARSPAARVAAFRRLGARHLGRSRARTAGRFSTRTCRRRSRCGTCGRRSRRCRSRSSRRRRASRWTGRRSARCASAASRSRRSRWRRASRRPATPELDRRLPFDEPYRIPAAPRPPSAKRAGRADAIVAVGTTVVRALEHAAAGDGVVQRGRGRGEPAHRAGQLAACRRRDPLGDARAGQQPLPAAARVCRRCDAGGRERRRSRRRAIGRMSSATRCSSREKTTPSWTQRTSLTGARTVSRLRRRSTRLGSDAFIVLGAWSFVLCPSFGPWSCLVLGRPSFLALGLT